MIHLNTFECHEPRGRDIQMNRMLLVSMRTVVLMLEIEVALVEGVERRRAV